jgi:membrane protein implicated in regulation of membrane protease activity
MSIYDISDAASFYKSLLSTYCDALLHPEQFLRDLILPFVKEAMLMSAVQWILVAVLCGAIEIFTSGFWFLWLALAALLVAAGVTLTLLASLPSQLLVFALITLIFVVFTRPLVLKLIKSNDTFSNVNALIGQHGISTTRISPLDYGQVKVNGEIWTATAQEEIDADIRIVVTGIDGVKLVVKKALG